MEANLEDVHVRLDPSRQIAGARRVEEGHVLPQDVAKELVTDSLGDAIARVAENGQED